MYLKTFITVLALIFSVSLLSKFVSMPDYYQQSYTPRYYLDISFSSSSDALRMVPTVISFTDSNGQRKKQFSKKFEFVSGNTLTNTRLSLPLPTKISSLDIEFKSPKGSIQISDLKLSDRRIDLNDDNISVLMPKDKYSIKDNHLEFTSPSDSPFLLGSMTFTIKKEVLERANAEYRLNDDPLLLSIVYRIVNYMKEHAGTVKIPLVLMMICLFFKYRSSIAIQTISLGVAFILAYTLVLFDDAKALFENSFNGDLKAFYKIFYSQSMVLSTMLLFVLSGALIHCQITRTENAFKSGNKIEAVKNIVLRLLFFSCFVAVVLLCALITADIFTYSQFATHLVINDIFTFTKDATKSFGLITDFISHKSLLATLCAFIMISAVIIMISKRCLCKKTLIEYMSLYLVCAVVFFMPEAARTLKDGSFASIFNSSAASINIKKSYSDSYDYKKDDVKTVSVDGLGQKKNIIFLMVESLSANESRYLGGEFDNTPYLDRLAKDALVFENYFTNGYNTDTGNFAFLTGIPYLESGRSYTDDRYYSNTLIKNFKKSGYTTNVFFSAQNIGFLDIIWEKAGFDNFYSGTDEYYNNSERLLFNSVPDGIMFDNLARYVPSWMEKGSFFTFVMTTTSHGPFVVPVTHEFDYHKTIRYVDKAIYELYQKLEAMGFFGNGMLVISGDHRAMIPYSEYENTRFGSSGIARVPLIIIDKNLCAKIKYPYSHAQAGALLEYLNLEKTSYYDFNYLPALDDSRTLGKAIYYQSHSPADEVIIVDGMDKDGNVNEYNMTIRGDDTDLSDNNLPGDKRREILENTYWIRK